MVRVTKGSVGLIGASVVLMVGLMPGIGQTANTVTSSDIVDGTIQAVDIGPNAVGQSEIQTNGVGAAEIATDAVRAPEIMHDAVGASEIALNAVGQAEIVADGVRTSEIAWNAVGASEIAPDAVGTSELAPDAVTATEIATGAVGAAEIATDGVDAAEIKASAVGTSEIADGAVGSADLSGSIQVETATTYSVASSFQLLAADLTLGSGAGTSAVGGTAFLGAAMGNVLGDGLTETHNYVGGVIGHYSVTGSNASTYPVGAVLGGIGDGTTSADGAFVAYTDGDSPTLTTAGAAFKVMNNNSTATNGFDFGVDLQDDAHDGYLPVDENFYNKAPLRLVRNAVVLVNTGAPTDGVTGDNVAGTGSLYVDTTNGVLYINIGAISAPDWETVGSQP